MKNIFNNIRFFIVDIINYLNRWNWNAYFVILIICIITAMTNESYKTLSEALDFGIVGGNIFGLMLAWVMMD